jgi:acetolactate synthase I/II/III large subunit|tara:strand:- start:7718 stop:9496 length:1779 start_codon:yes stop_codon:yes gene_type:complete
MRLADYIVKFIEKKKIDTIFTVSGGGSIFLCDALYKSKKIKYISHHHEQAASFAAESYARSKNKIGCCFVTTGPGGTNTVTGVSSAWIDSVPVVFISGQVFLNQTIQNTKKRQIGVQEINIIDLVKPITKFAKMIVDPETIDYYLEKAFDVCQSGRPGPVFLDIPADLQNAEIDEKKIKKIKYFSKKNNYKIDKSINTLLKKLQTSKRPLIHLGHGVRLANASSIVKKIFNKHKIPFVVTWNADDLIPSNHKMYFGRPGAFGERGSNFIVQNCDFYLSIGSRLPFMVTGYNSKNYASRAKFKCMVDIDINELKKKDINFNLKVQCDAKYFLENLFKKLKKFNSNNIWLDYCKNIRKKYPVLINKMRDEKKYVNSYYFIRVLSELTRPHDSIITDMGFSFTTSHQAIEIKEKQKFYTNSGHAPMGWGLPAAIGAYYANKKKINNIICLSGEGGLQMNLQELATVMHNKIPLKLFIFNNGGYLTIKQTQILGFKGRIMGADKKSGLSFPDYNKIAKSHKMSYLRIKDHKNIKNKIKKILKNKNPVICEIMMNPNEEQMPKAINRRNKLGKSVPTELEDMYPFLPREELKDNYLD